MLYARRKQLKTLSKLCSRAEEAAQVGLIVGHEGVGKTVLARAALEQVSGAVVRLRALSADRGVPLSCIHELARALGITASGSVDEMAESLVGALSAKPPIAVFIDDIHLIDPESQAVLWQTVRRLHSPSLLLLATVPGAFWLSEAVAEYVDNDGDYGALIQLDPFSTDEVADFVSDRLGVRPENRALTQVMDITGGYPGLVSSFVEILGRLRNIPEALDELLSGIQGSRLTSNRMVELLAGLGVGERAALVAIALARQISVGQLAHVLQLRETPACNVAALERAGLLRVGSEGELRISNILLERTIIEMTGHSDLLASHRALAEVLVGRPALPHRVEAAAPKDRGGLLLELRAQVEAAMMQRDYEVAFQLSVLASRIEPELLLTGALAAIRAARFDLLVRNEAVFNVLPASTGRTSTLVLLAIENGELAQARELLDNIPLDQFKNVQELIIFGQALLRLCAAEALAGRNRPLGEKFDALIEVFESQDLSRDPAHLEEYLTIIVVLRAWAKLPDAPRRGYLSCAAALREIRDESDQLLPAPVIHLMLAAVLLAAGELTEASRMLTMPELEKDQELALISAILLTHLRFWNGDWDDTALIANQLAGRMLEGIRNFAWQQVDSIVALVPLCRGGEALPTGLLAEARANEMPTFEVIASELTRAWVGTVNGTAPADIARSMDVLWSSGMFEWAATLPTAVLWVRAALAAGDRRAAFRVQDEIREVEVAPAVRNYVAAHIDALIAADAGYEFDAARAFANAKLAMDEHLFANPEAGLKVFDAILAEDWGRFCVAFPNRYVRDVLSAAENGRRLAQHCQAAKWEERLGTLVEQLCEIGEAKGHPVLVDESHSMLDILTSREREISLLVAQGMTNKEIAARLYITVRTAEYHVHNSLTKLGMKSRVELRETLRPKSAGPQQQPGETE